MTAIFRAENTLGLPREPTAVTRAKYLISILFASALGGCAGKEPPPLENSFCVIYQRLPDPADAIHMKKRENKIAVLTNEESANRECRSGDRGPR